MYRGSLSSRMPYGGHVILLFTFTFAALILSTSVTIMTNWRRSILITFSSPFISSINFLYLPSTSGSTTFGSFGWCSPGYCLQNQVAYEALTGGMMLWAISIIFTAFTVLAILPLLFIHESRALRYVGNRAFFTYASDLSAMLVCLAWLFSVYGWSIAHRAFEMAGTEVRMGSAVTRNGDQDGKRDEEGKGDEAGKGDEERKTEYSGAKPISPGRSSRVASALEVEGGETIRRSGT
ncbi:hypothetical protein JCM24511_04359 [Saitozyma sp. JCM 24511]|nr:hypothetical protein JCM24511_04359 [Saitozyma sp. JCM 24511]